MPLPRVHFGDLDPAGVRIFRHLRQIYSELKWAVPDFWSEHIEERALSGAWPDDLDLDAAPTLIRELASRGLWLGKSSLPWTRDFAPRSRPRERGSS